jgi:hypothetical protein
MAVTFILPQCCHEHKGVLCTILCYLCSNVAHSPASQHPTHTVLRPSYIIYRPAYIICIILLL